MHRRLILIAFIFIACIDFDIDAPYDDINGIYLEHITEYRYPGSKIAVENEKGYVLHTPAIVCYDLADVYHIDSVSVYQSVYQKPDFAVVDGYAYVVSDGFGLEIVDFNQTNPQLAGFLPISGSIYSIALSDASAFITSDWNLYVIDVSSIASPAQIAEYTFDHYLLNAQVDSDTLYVLFVGGDLQIIDITEPTNPQLIIEYNLSDTLNSAYYFVKQDDYLYVNIGSDIETYEIQADGHLEYQNTLSFSHSVMFLKTYEGFGLCLRGDAVYLLNLEYPSRPCIGEALELPYYTAHGVINGQYIYLVGNRLLVVEIKDIE